MMDCECGWSFIIVLYVLIALALYGLFHWIEVLLDLPITDNDENPGTSYDNLRKLIHTIIQEVLALPEIYSQIGGSVNNLNANQVATPFEPKKYEDLLATAVLNKIVENYSNEKKYETSSGIVSAGSDFDSNYTNGKSSSRFDQNSRRSSIEPQSESSTHEFRGDSSMSMKAADIIDEIFREKLGSTNFLRTSSIAQSVSSEEEAHLNNYLQNHKVALPHLDADADNSDDIEEEFESVYTANTTLDPNISANWVFKKRNSRGSSDGTPTATIAPTAPIGMLVPSPAIEVKTLIGDQNADEISDLSEAGSDLDNTSDIEDNRNSIDIPHVLVENKTIIGGRNEMSTLDQSTKHSLNELLEPASLVSEQSLTGQSPVISEAKNNLLFMNDYPATSKSQKLPNMSNGVTQTEDKSDLLIDWTSSNVNGSVEANDVDIVTKTTNKNKFDFEPVPAPRAGANGPHLNGTTMKFAESPIPFNIEEEDRLISIETLSHKLNALPHQEESFDTAIVPGTSICKALNICTVPALVAVEVATEPNTPLQIEKMLSLNLEKIKDDILTNRQESAVEKSPLNSNIEYSSFASKEIYEEFKDSLENDNKTNVLNLHVDDNYLNITNKTNDSIEQDSLEDIKNTSNRPIAAFVTAIGQKCSNDMVDEKSASQLHVKMNSNCSSGEALESLVDDRDKNQVPPGSIAEREHMKWKNAIDLPNNPYSPEALQRRLSQTSPSRTVDVERLAAKFEAKTKQNETKPVSVSKPVKVILGEGQPDQIRYGRDYYINDAKTSSGSRKKKSCADLNYIQTCDNDYNNDGDYYDDDIDHHHHHHHHHHRRPHNGAANDNDDDDYKYNNNNNNNNDDDDSVSDLELYYNRKRYRNAHTPKYFTLKPKNDSHYSLINNNNYSGGEIKRSMSLCSLRTYRMKNTNGIIDNRNNIETDHTNFFAQFEKNALLSDIRRNSFSSRSGTRNFVLNPLFDESIQSDC